MVELSQVLQIALLVITLVSVVLVSYRHKHHVLSSLKKEMKEDINTQLVALYSDVEEMKDTIKSMSKTFAQKEDMRMHMQLQTELLQEVRKEQSRIHARLDEVLTLAVGARRQ